MIKRSTKNRVVAIKIWLGSPNQWTLSVSAPENSHHRPKNHRKRVKTTHLDHPCKMPPEYAAIFTFCAATSDRAAEVQHKMSEQYKRPVFPDYPFLVTMVKIRSIQLGFSTFLEHVGSFTKFFKLYVEQKILIASSWVSELKSPIRTKFSYLRHRSFKAIPIRYKWFLIISLWGLYVPISSHFLFFRFISIAIASIQVLIFYKGYYPENIGVSHPPLSFLSNLRGTW